VLPISFLFKKFRSKDYVQHVSCTSGSCMRLLQIPKKKQKRVTATQMGMFSKCSQFMPHVLQLASSAALQSLHDNAAFQIAFLKPMLVQLRCESQYLLPGSHNRSPAASTSVVICLAILSTDKVKVTSLYICLRGHLNESLEKSL